MKAGLLCAVALAAVMGSCVTSNAQTITYNGVSVVQPGVSIPLSSLVTAHEDNGTIGGEITISHQDGYSVDNAFYHVGTDYYSAQLWGYNNIPNPPYTDVNLTFNKTGLVSVGGNLRLL
jgi:hypothetical protein